MRTQYDATVSKNYNCISQNIEQKKFCICFVLDETQTGKCHIERKELLAHIAEQPQRADFNLPDCLEDGQYNVSLLL